MPQRRLLRQREKILAKTRRVYYLTGAMTGVACIAMQRLKVSRFSDLNDPFELMAVNVNNKAMRRAFNATRTELNTATGLICFTRDWKSPLMWGHYADKHAGMALGFDIPSELLKDVNYATRLSDLKIDQKTNKPDECTLNNLISTKFSEWSYEKECRLFVELDTQEAEGGMYFLPFSDTLKFREIVLGPRSTYKITDIRSLAKKLSGNDKLR